MGLADGPTEVHKATVAKQVLRDYQPTDDIWPTEWTPRKREAAQGEVRRLPRERSGESVSDRSCSARARHRAARRLDGRRGAARQG